VNGLFKNRIKRCLHGSLEKSSCYINAADLARFLYVYACQEMPQQGKGAAIMVKVYEVFVTIALWGLSLPLT
jgi:hypothetical protein